MSMPELKPSFIKPCDAYADILESIALQEAGLAHIINAEGEKIQTALGISQEGRNFPPMVRCVDDLLKVNDSVSDLLVNVIKLEMVLEFKLKEVAKLSNGCKPPCPPHRICEAGDEE